MVPFGGAEAGFPKDRLNAATRYLWGVKRWWRRLGSRMIVVPIVVPPAEGATFPWGACMSTDQGMRLCVDRAFATLAPIHLIAGIMEKMYQHHARDSWSRLSWLSPEEWQRYANLCFGLEINSSIHSEAGYMTEASILDSLNRSGSPFMPQELERWNVLGAPDIDPHYVSLLPELMGFPPGLSAEQYLPMLTTQGLSNDSGSRSGSSGQNREKDETDEIGDHDSGQSEQPQEPDSIDPFLDDLFGDDSENEFKDKSATSTPLEEEPKDKDSNDSNSNESKNEEKEKEKEKEKDEGKPARDGTATSDNETNPSSPESNGGGEEGDGSSQQVVTLKDIANDPDQRWWSHELSNPSDPLDSPGWSASEESERVERGEKERALVELAEDVMESSKDSKVPGHGTGPGNNVLDWAISKTRARRLDIASRFNRLVSTAYDTALTKGASDLSYTVRNPSQPEIGPIFMGMHSYAPKVVVLQDISRSMMKTDFMRQSLETFTTICNTVLSRYGESVTWITVDSEVVAVGRSLGIDRQIEEDWKRGWGGTVIGPVVEQLASGRFSWGHKRVERPDLLILVTDCGFRWPQTRPDSRMSIIVCSVIPWEKAKSTISSWVHPIREFLYVGDAAEEVGSQLAFRAPSSRF